MNRSELEAFFNLHDARCPGFMDRMGETEDLKLRVDWWVDQLADVTPAEADAASRTIATMSPKPYFSDHLNLVKTFVAKARRTDTSGIRCFRCNGTGIASCKIHIPHWSGDQHPVRRAPGIYPCLCPCSKGKAKGEKQNRLLEDGAAVHLIPEKPNWVGGKTGRPAAEYVEAASMTELELVAVMENLDEGALKAAMAGMALKPIKSAPPPKPEDWLEPAKPEVKFDEFDPDYDDGIPF